MQPGTSPGSGAAETPTRERCSIAELSNTPDDPGLSVARARVAPGITTRWHRLVGIAERYVMLEGHARAEIGGLPPQELRPGDVLRIAPGQAQRITNTGNEDLVFLALCTPRFRWDAYEDIDDAMSAA